MKPTPFDNSIRDCLRVAALGALLLTGCQATPPRYLGTWQRVTSKHYCAAIPYCHGYTPTHWSRWPEECGPHEMVIVEEVPRPMQAPEAPGPVVIPPPPPVAIPPQAEAPPAPEPDAPPAPTTDDVIVPQSFLRQEMSDSTAQAPTRKSAHAATWSEHLARYVSEITTMR